MVDLASFRALSVEALLAVAIGLLLLVSALGLLGKVLPFSLRTAISGQRNDAVSVLIFSVLLGLGIIVSATLSTPEHDPAVGASSPAAPARSGAPAPAATTRR